MKVPVTVVDLNTSKFLQAKLTDARNIAPEGWHVSNMLNDYFNIFESPNPLTNTIIGFNLTQSGSRSEDGYLSSYGYAFWTSSESKNKPVSILSTYLYKYTYYLKNMAFVYIE